MLVGKGSIREPRRAVFRFVTRAQLRMVCSECGADRDVDELLATPAPADAAPTRKAALPGAAPPPPLAKRAELPKKPDADVDEMLAALKRKIARKPGE